MKNITYYNAGAGSGKTFKLTEKLLDIFKDEKVAPENVILTTFTKAAAADFKRKTREKLLSNGMLGVASSLEDAKIGTVHSVGLHYIRKYWYILGRSSTFNEMDDKAKEVYISRTLSEVATDEDIALFHRFARARDLKDRGKYRLDFWKYDLKNIIEVCDTFGITDLDACLAKSLEHIRKMYPGGDAEDIAKVTERLFSIAKRWRKGFNEFKEKNNLLSFSDMETLFLELLENDLVKEDIRSTIKYVFVDEFQDSNQVQLKIFDKLSELVERSYWVGDPKQAIYRFRGCDTELVAAIMNHLKTCKDKGYEYSRELDKSWRSVEPLVKLANSTFIPMFEGLLDKDDVKLNAVRTATMPGNPPAIYHWDLEARVPEGKTRKAANREMLLDATAAKVRDILEGKHHIKMVVDKDSKELRNIRPSDIAILFLKDGESAYISQQAGWLRSYGIPVDCPESYNAGRAEVALVKCLLTYMVDSDADLLKAEIARLMYDKSLEELIVEGFDYEIFKVLDDIRSGYQTSSVSNLVLRIIHGLNLQKHCGRWGDAELRTRVLDAIVQLAREYEGSADATVEGFISSFPDEIEVQGDPDGVKIMTYHASKGLEWPVVILDTTSREDSKAALKHFCCGVTVTRESKPTPDNLYSDFTLRYCPDFRPTLNSNIDSGVLANVQADFADYWEEVVSDSRRLLYVGMTRARDYLVTLSMGGKTQAFLDECGCALDLKGLSDQTYNDLWGKDAPMTYYELIRDAQDTPEKEEETDFKAIKPVEEENPHLLRNIVPSTDKGDKSEVGAVATVSERISHGNTSDYATFGTCIHDMFAVYDPAKEEDSVIKTFCQIAEAHDMSEVLTDKKSIVASVKGLYGYLTEKYGSGKAHKEYPFMYKNHLGQIVGGTIDLLWETPDGVVVVDYKNYPGFDDVTNPDSKFFAGKYGPQLAAYRDAAAMMSGDKVLDTLVFYSVQGRIVRLK